MFMVLMRSLVGGGFYAVPRGCAKGGFWSWSTAHFAKLRRQFRQRLIKVCYQAVVGDLEDRRLLILVDGDDDLGVLHAREMLDRPGNPDRDVKIRRHHLAGLADLPVVRRVAGV